MTEETATPGSGAARPHLLDEGECLALLASQQVGRLAFVAERAVVVVPVNFRLDGNRPVFRVEKGGTIETVVSDAAVGFQVDSINERTRSGWSVLVQGTAETISDAGEVARLRGLEVDPWAQGERTGYVRVEIAAISGRRITPDLPPGLWLG